MTATQRLEIRVLGELSVRRGGQPLDLPASRKTRALLGYLVATAGEPHSRQRLCDLLWDGPVDPRGELRWSLSKLRALLDDQRGRILRAARDHVGFEPGGADSDLAALASLETRGLDRLAASELERAEALFRGELLAGLELPDCFRFASWLVAERERLFALHTALLERQVACHAAAPERALRAARSWVAHDPLSEAAHAAAVRALFALGRPREANQQAEACRRILKQELGVAPGAQLEAARRQGPRDRPEMVRGAPEASVAASPPGPTAAASVAAPFCGRQRELELARATVASAIAAGSPHLLLVSGEAGIGKSRLLAELAAAVRATGATTLGGRGFEAELGRPYGVWIDLLGESFPASTGGDAAARPAPPGASGVEGARPQDPFDRERLLRAVARELSALARERPLLLLVDDLQWVDEASVTLLSALIAHGAGAGWAVAAGLRAGELGAQAPAARMLRDLERSGRSTHLVLSALSSAASAELARAVDPEIDGERIAQTSGGHPLFTLELARGGRTLGDGLPASLAAAIGERLARLDAAARRLATWAAVLGTAFEVETLRGPAGLAPGELLSGLEELERAAILRPDAAGERYDFAHDLVRRVAYEQIPPPRRRWLHAALARSIAPGLERDDRVAVAVARHAALGGESELAAHACLVAAERCLRLAAVGEAEAHCESGLGHLAQADAAETLGLRFGLLRALVHATQGRPQRAGLAAEVGRWVGVARAAGRAEQLQIGLYLQAALFYAEGDLSEAERQVLAQAEALRGAEPMVAARALSNAGRCLAQIERDHARAEALLRDGGILAERAGLELLDVPWGLGMLAQAAGRDEEARRELERAVELAHQAGDPWIESQCLSRLAALALEHGEAERAIRWSEELQRLEAKVGEGTEGAIAAGVAALARWGSAGQSGAATDALERAIAALRAADSKSNLAFILNQAASRELAGGRPERAAERAREALAAAVAVGRKGQIARARLLLAQVAAAGGERGEARREIAAAIDQNRPPGALGGRAWGEIESLARELGVPTLVPTPRRQSPRRARGERP